jgi:hypothetical protein
MLLSSKKYLFIVEYNIYQVSPNYQGYRFMCGPQDLKIFSLGPRRNISWSPVVYEV